MRRLAPRMRKAVAALLSVAALSVTVGIPATAHAQAGPQEVIVPAGKSQVVQLPAAYADVMVADAKIADVMPLSTRSIYVVGKAMGATSITVYGPNKEVVAALSIQVSPDVESLKTRLHEILPNERDVAVRTANQSIVLSGVVSSPTVLSQIVTLAATYAPDKVVNMMGVEGSQQVMLSVRFVEMQRSTAKNLRLNVQSSPSVGDFRFVTGDTLLNNAGGALDTMGNLAALIRTGSGNLEVIFDALETKGLVKTLAQPNLVSMSGETASFLAGGEFPVPVAATPGAGALPTVSIEFKQFGIALAFTPTILSDGLVNLVVAPEVSSIDPNAAVVVSGFRIPGLKVRRTRTTIEMRDGESFTIAGLMMDDYQNSIRQLPFVGDVPVLGALFRSTGYQHNETELVVVVTPHLVTPRRGQATTPADSFVRPSDFDLFLLGSLRGSASRLSAEDRALLASDPSRGGVDGPHGHIIR